MMELRLPSIRIAPEKLQRICKVLFYVALGNFLAFAIISAFLGGTAPNGKIEDGHYYVGDHNRYTEVSKIVFEYSRIHTTSMFVTHGLAFLAAFVSYRIERKKN
jgi:hypothetical protein